MMDREVRKVTLGEVLNNFRDYETSEELFLLDEEGWGADTKGMILNLDDLIDEEETEVMKFAEEKNMIHTLLLSEIEEVVLNANLQKRECTLDELVSAFIFYYNNDAFIDFEEEIECHKPELSKEEKKALIKKWKTAQKKKYILSKTQAQKLFRYLEAQLAATPCDNTLLFTKQWLKDNIPQEKTEHIIAEIKDMGGYCDCEVLLNCYNNYDISVN